MNRIDKRTRLLLEGPLAPTLLRLALPNVLVMGSQAAVGLVETYFVGKLGTDALAGMSLVFPVFMLMQMMSAGAIGGGIASSIAQARGAGRDDEATSLVWHAVVVALLFGLASCAVMLAAGRWAFGVMGGQGASLEAALRYATVAFGGAVFVWLFNALAAAVRGTGNMVLPACVTLAGLAVLLPLSPLLIFGWGPIPALGIAGGAVALLLYYALGTAALAWHLVASGLLPRRPGRMRRIEWSLLGRILRVGMLSAIGTVCTNASVMLGTAYVGRYGVEALAGYGTASRLEYLVVPLVFGFGAPLLAVVGTCIGAGRPERALRAAWIGAGMVFVLTEAIGLAAALVPHAWLALFTSDAAAIDHGARYLRIVAPCYGLFGVGLVLYFASQGAGRLQWAIWGNLTRMVVVGAGGWLVVESSGGMDAVYGVLAVGLAAYCAIIGWSVAGGSWFGPIGRPRLPAALMRSLQAGPSAGHRRGYGT